MSDKEINQGPWQSAGSIVYKLIPTGAYPKGESVMNNEYFISVQKQNIVRDESSEARAFKEAKLAEHIAKLLNEFPFRG